MNKLRYADFDNAHLEENGPFAFAKRYALHLFPTNSIYNFIPKNACSTLRFSLAVANGFLDADSDPNWIDNNINWESKIFKANDYVLATSAYTFVILRCPFRRLASAFLDKAVDMKFPITSLGMHMGWSLKTPDELVHKIQALNFTSFVEAVCSTPRHLLDEHFRPQTDFLILADYHRWFCFEKFDSLQAELLKDIGFVIHDTRSRIGHNRSGFRLVAQDHSQTSIGELQTMKQNRILPQVESLYCQNTIRMVSNYYRDDIKLYRGLFGAELTLA